MPDIPHNWTPTFRLTSIEKPDMSPYLFHMTTRESLKSILEDRETEEHQGRLYAKRPRHSRSCNYDIRMVCFTETPPFALDFFRYRWSDDKNRENLKYGIGFDKEAMVRKGVFPSFYVSNELKSRILSLSKQVDEYDLADKLKFLEFENENDVRELKKILEDTSQTLASVKRLMFPLLEQQQMQGFIWEREWRYASPDNADFIFSYDDIRIICCVNEDEDIFKNIIGDTFIKKNPIKFIKTWEKYDEITDFINRRNQDSYKNNKKKIQEILYEVKGIDRYISQVENRDRNISQIKELRNDLDKEIKKIALIQVFEEISQGKATEKLKEIIMETNHEIVIQAIATYDAYAKTQKIHKRSNYLIKVIENKKKNPNNSEKDNYKYEKEISNIKNRINEIIEKDVEIDY